MVTTIARLREVTTWCEAFTTQQKPTTVPTIGDTIVSGIGDKYLVGAMLGCGRVRINHITDQRPAVMGQYKLHRMK